MALSIAVVGGGTAGPASALLLHRLGHSVTLFEKVSRPGALGAGLLVQPPALLVLHQLGVLPAVLAHGARVHSLNAYIPSGRRVLHTDYRRVHEELFGLGLHRGTLEPLSYNAFLCDLGLVGAAGGRY